MTAAVRLESLRKVFPDGTLGLDDVSLEVPAGEFVYKYLPRPKGNVPLGELSGLLHMEGFNGGWEFAGAVTVAPLAFPGNIKMETLKIAEGQTESKAVLTVEANAPPREYSLTITAQGQVPFTTESDKAKGMRLVTLPSRTLTVIVLPAAKK